MRSQFLKQVVTGALLALFLVPNVLPALHELLEHHEHSVCTAIDQLHWHDDVQECELCDYLIGLKPFSVDEKEEHVLSRGEAFAYFTIDIAIVDRPFMTPPERGPPAC